MVLKKIFRCIDQADIDVYKLPIANAEEIVETEKRLQKNIPDELKMFYLNVSNGMEFGRLKILPVFSVKNK